MAAPSIRSAPWEGSRSVSALLLAGGAHDPNLTAVAAAVERAGCGLIDLRTSDAFSPGFAWTIPGAEAFVDEKHLAVEGAFMRHDVFASMNDARVEVANRASAWYQSIAGFVLANPDVAFFNRDIAHTATNKPAQLALAARCGLRVPQTSITNVYGTMLGRRGPSIAKPVGGGGFCRSLDDSIAAAEFREGRAAMPAIVQSRLVAPEIRIYVIGDVTIAFEMRSPSLDYRELQDADVSPLSEPPPEANRLRGLMAALRMDFGAADFKTDPDSGDLTFLELNTSPMFARFDQVCGGRVGDAIVRGLVPDACGASCGILAGVK